MKMPNHAFLVVLHELNGTDERSEEKILKANCNEINATFIKRAIDAFMSHFEGKLPCCYNVQTVHS